MVVIKGGKILQWGLRRDGPLIIMAQTALKLEIYIKKDPFNRSNPNFDLVFALFLGRKQRIIDLFFYHEFFFLEKSKNIFFPFLSIFIPN